eukprot:TRINITY_DN3354_c0_g1_i1.p2 TRINITY_DN3354_c0_g1~~TRINITY_DN3354_c0_g1_i1.p2  ORF type:complete len:106 (-),score=5.48 TRINITY_DN3354_c0_g1_i1:391-708(-)
MKLSSPPLLLSRTQESRLSNTSLGSAEDHKRIEHRFPVAYAQKKPGSPGPIAPGQYLRVSEKVKDVHHNHLGTPMLSGESSYPACEVWPCCFVFIHFICSCISCY